MASVAASALFRSMLSARVLDIDIEHLFPLIHAVAGSGAGSGGCRGPARPRKPQRSGALGDDPRVRRRDLPRGDVQERAQPRAGRIGDAVRLDGEPLPGLHPCVLVLLRPRHARVPRPRRGARLRFADRREDQRRRRAREGAAAGHVAARPGHARHQHRPLPARRGPLPAHARDRRRAHRIGHAVLDPHEGHAAAAGSSAAAGCRGIRAGVARDVDRGVRRRASARRRAGHAVGGGAARDRAGGDRGRVPGDGVPDADPAAPDRLDRRDRRRPHADQGCRSATASSSARCTCGPARSSGSCSGCSASIRSSSRRTSGCIRARRDGAEGVPLVAGEARAPAPAGARPRRPRRGRRRPSSQRRRARARGALAASSRPREDGRRGGAARSSSDGAAPS